MSEALLIVDGFGGLPLSRLDGRYVVAGSGWYAHRARSAAMYGDRLTVSTMCGQVLNRPIVSDEPVGPECATCWGRSTALDPHGRPVAWAPRGHHWLPKRWCAGTANRWYVPVDDTNYSLAVCLACGQTVPLRGGHGWNGLPTTQRHHHAGSGVCCRVHGRRRLVQDGDRIACCAWEAHGPCGRTASRFWLIGGGS